MHRRPSTHLWMFLVSLCLITGTTAHATITVLDYWRLGENDPGIAAPGIIVTNTIDEIGSVNLTVHGNAHYTNDVAASAMSHVASRLSVNFTNGAYASNGIVSTATDNFGIECWVKPTALGGGQVIAYNGSTGGAGDGGWGLIIAADNTYQVLFGGIAAFGTTPALTNVWTHLALVEADGTATLYVNGVPTDTAAATPGQLLAGGFALAAPPQAPTSQNFTGLIDEVRVFTFAPGQFNTNDLLINRSFRLGTTNVIEGPSAGMDSVAVALPAPGDSWTASENASWMDGDFTGSGNVIFEFDANPGPTRTGTITIAGQTVTVTQAGANYVPAGLTTLVSSGLNYPEGIAVDNAGNVYIADYFNKAIKEWHVTSQTVTSLVSSELRYPTGVALDSAGNVYIADTGTNVIKEWIASSQTVTNLIGGFRDPASVCVDITGNVYVGDFSYSAVFEWNATSQTLTNLISPAPASGIAVDIAGNLYLNDLASNNCIEEWNALSGIRSVLISPTNSPSVAVDGSGNVYTVDNNSNIFKKWSPATETVTDLFGGLSFPGGLAADAVGDVYIADTVNNSIEELPRAFVNAARRIETTAAGSDSLPPVVPATANLTGVFAPTSDQPWLTINNVANGIVSFSFTTSTTNRTAHINVLGVSVPVTQAFPATPPKLTAVTLLGNNAIRFSFTNNPNASFTVLASTNLTLPLAQWSAVGVATNIGGTTFQFATPISNGPRMFYRVSSP